ncbi:MAG TPA: hypothetical protein VFQ61_17020 [Polyangiaceae bacterium]|nr:hypothetical protein [Polyangiaceae bacterium]
MFRKAMPSKALSWVSSLSIAFFAAHCTVTSDDDDTTACEPNETRTCSCSDGSKGTQTCTPGGTRFGACAPCTGSTGGAGGENSAGGESGSTSGGTTSGGTTHTGGSGGSTTQAGSGGDTGGVTSSGGAGGNGGAGGDANVGGAGALCADAVPVDKCDECLLSQCCEEYVACSGEAECSDVWSDFAKCVEDLRVNGEATPANVKQCADIINVDEDENPLPPSPATGALIDCMGGSDSWSSASSWPSTACTTGCFKP